MADGVEGVPEGLTGTPIQGVPAGVTGSPIQGVEGVPEGLTGTPIQGVPAGVTGSPIQPPQTLGQQVRTLAQDVWSGGESSSPMTNLGVGAWKEAMSGVGGLLKIINDKIGSQPQPSDVLEYKQQNPGATDQQALDAVHNQGYRGPSSNTARVKSAARAQWLLQNSDKQGFFQHAGGFGENLTELALLSALGAPEAGVADTAAEASKLWKMMEGNGAASRLLRVGWSAVKNAIEQGGQTFVHTGGDTGQAQTSAELGGTLGAAGQVVGEGVGAYKQFMGRAAEEVQPITRTDLPGTPFTQLASELKGPSGEPLASTRAQEAADITREPELLRERLRAFKTMQGDLARTGVTNMLNDTNSAINASTIGENIRATAPSDVVGQGDRWRYIPPDGSTALSASEARSAMDEIKQQWLSKETTPEQNSMFSQAYSDIQQQLARHDSYLAVQPYLLHDPANATAGIDSWRDAANQADALANAKMRQIGTSQKYQEIVAARDAAQEAFDKTMYSGDLNEHIRAQRTLTQTSDDLANFIKTEGAQPQVSPVIAQRAYEEQRIANGFREMQNVIDSHMTLRDARAAAINRPQEIKGLGTLTDDLEQVQAKYGDVLNPILGEHAFDHLIELGDLMESPQGENAKSLLDHVTSVLKRHYFLGKLRAGLSGGSALLAAGHLLGHSVGGTTGGLAVLGADAYYRWALHRMATNPEVARAFIAGAKSKVPISTLGPQLARIFATGATTAERQQTEPPPQRSTIYGSR